jgi:hypothetical protein
MNASSEFETVELIIKSSSETRGVDAFALALIKAERQLRKLFTHLIYQFPCFSVSDVVNLRAALASNKDVYFKGIETGINSLFSCTVEEMVGDKYKYLRSRISDAIDHRNKIFHGQLTQSNLNRDDLLTLVVDIRAWCDALANGAILKVGYDGFIRNSFQKSTVQCLSAQFKVQFSGVDSYSKFIEQYMRRQ